MAGGASLPSYLFVLCFDFLWPCGQSQIAIVEPREYFPILTFLICTKYCPSSVIR